MLGQQTSYAYQAPPAAVASVEERLGFLRKVYGLLSASLVTATVGAFLGSTALVEFTSSNRLLLFVAEIGFLLFAMFARHKPGLNMVALFGFTTMSGLTIGPLVAMYAGTNIIGQALALTTLTFVSLTAYVMISKKDFSFMGGFLFVGLIIIVVGGLLNAFVFQSPMMQFVMSGAGVFLFSGFILYDTSNIMRNYPTDEYVSATLALYLDILNLFVMIVNLLGMSRD